MLKRIYLEKTSLMRFLMNQRNHFGRHVIACPHAHQLHTMWTLIELGTNCSLHILVHVDGCREVNKYVNLRFIQWVWLEASLFCRSKDDLAWVSISFKVTQVPTFKRLETISFASGLSIFGGLLGLFMGVSLLSIIEFIYFSTLRLFWTLRQRQIDNFIVPIQQTTIKTNSNDSQRERE